MNWWIFMAVLTLFWIGFACGYSVCKEDIKEKE